MRARGLPVRTDDPEILRLRRAVEKMGAFARCLMITGRFLKPYTFSGYLGIPFRGAFGAALRRLFCAHRRPGAECAACKHRFVCPVYLLFETGPDIVPEHMRKIARKYRRITRPFVIRPPTPSQIKQSCFTFSIILIGPKAIALEPLVVIPAIKAMGEQGIGYDKAHGEKRYFQITRIDAYNPFTGKTALIYDPATGYDSASLDDPKTCILEEDLERLAERALERRPRLIKVRFHTPTMLTHQKEPAILMEARILVSNLARKYSLLRLYQFERDPLTAEEARRIIEAASMIQLAQTDIRTVFLRRYSLKRRRWERYGPFIRGLALYRIPESFWEHPASADVIRLLYLGTIIHAGKFPTAGCGLYDLALI